MLKSSEQEQRQARFWLSLLLELSAPPLFWGAHTIGFQGNTAGPGGFRRGNADNQGQCLGSKRERDRDRGRSLPLSNSPLEGGRRRPAGGSPWGKERRWEATSGPPPAQSRLRPREGRALAHAHTACRRQERGPSRRPHYPPGAVMPGGPHIL